ncbi:MAG: ATP F0F1 synthase subunit B [Leptolyngbya sp. SIO1E4]|nr:ATP F0F1 synthase subunit B [Leptolyngbya sp. SIO1E4]
MLIDPFTVLAQIVNFLILVVLLRHFLYGPITRAMAQREQTIAERLEQAKQQETAAQQEAERLQQMQQDFVAHRNQRQAQVRSHLQEQRLTLLKQAREEVNTLKSGWYQALEQEKTGVLRAFRQQATYQLTQTVRQVLTDLADADLEQQMVETFLNQLGQTPESEKQGLRAALSRAEGGPVVIRSSFPLTEATQHALTKAVQAATLGQAIAPQFEVNAALGCGIELRAPGYKLEWNLAAYLDNLEQTLARILDQHPVKAEPNPLSA